MPDHRGQASEWVSQSMPALHWLRNYDRAWLAGDLVAGVTLAAYLLPAGIGDR
jgi:MFS superfamily sulfate permease-like transporter